MTDITTPAAPAAISDGEAFRQLEAWFSKRGIWSIQTGRGEQREASCLDWLLAWLVRDGWTVGIKHAPEGAAVAIRRAGPLSDDYAEGHGRTIYLAAVRATLEILE